MSTAQGVKDGSEEPIAGIGDSQEGSQRGADVWGQGRSSVSSPDQRSRPVPAKGPSGLQITATGDLGKNSPYGVAEGEVALQWLGSEWEVRTRMGGCEQVF